LRAAARVTCTEFVVGVYKWARELPDICELRACRLQLPVLRCPARDALPPLL
jgi:hypothetical protein